MKMEDMFFPKSDLASQLATLINPTSNTTFEVGSKIGPFECTNVLSNTLKYVHVPGSYMHLVRLIKRAGVEQSWNRTENHI